MFHRTDQSILKDLLAPMLQNILSFAYFSKGASNFLKCESWNIAEVISTQWLRVLKAGGLISEWFPLWHPFSDIWAKGENILRLGHL